MSTGTLRSTDATAIPRWAALAVFALIVSACGGNGTGEEPETQQLQPTQDRPAGTEVTATETEYQIELSQQEFEPGRYTLVARNEGETTHALAIEGEGLAQDTNTIGGGESTELTVTLDAGTYELYCPVGNHDDLGMTTTITVGSGSTPTGGTPTGGSGY